MFTSASYAVASKTQNEQLKIQKNALNYAVETNTQNELKHITLMFEL